MKIAVLFSGLPREVEECWESIQKYLLAGLSNPDVFIYSGEQYQVRSSFFQAFNPRIYMIEDQFRHVQMEEILKRIEYVDHGHMNSYAQQIWGLKKVWQLKQFYEQQSGVKYDIVVRARPDHLWFRSIPLDLLELDKISNLHHFPSPIVSTEFAIGPNNLMEKYFQVYDWVLEHGERCLTQDNPRLFTNEGKLKYHSDFIMATCLVGYHGMTMGGNAGLPVEHRCPYHYYRIMHLQKMGIYKDSDAGLFS